MKETDKLVVIKWEDSFGCGASWENFKDEDFDNALICYSAGYLIGDGEHVKVVAPHKTAPYVNLDSPQYCGDMTIPVKAILSITEIKDEIT